MTTSNYMPDVVVEIAFGDDYTTPAASRTWTDVSEFVELADGITITGGRSDERSTTEANTLSLTLDNTDGRFTFGKTTGAYYPDVVVGVPIRVRATRPGGSSSTRFVGYVDSWPVAWPGSDASARVAITATSRLARLGRLAPLGNAIAEEYLTDSPWGYWTLAGRADLTDQRGKLSFRGSGDKPTFDNPGPMYDGKGAAQFSGGRVLFKASGALPAEDDPVTVEAAVSVEAGERGGIFAFYGGSDPAANPVYYARVKANGKIEIGAETTGITGWSLESSVAIDDGLFHHVAVVYDGSDTLLYIDGALDSTDSGPFWLGSKFTIGGGDTDENPVYTTPTLTGAIAHFAIHDGALSATRIAAHSDIATAGQTNQTANDRLDLLASLAGIPAAETTFAPGGALLVPREIGGETVLELMRRVESSDYGVLYDHRDGSLAYDGYGARATATVDVTLSMAAQEVESSVALTVDRQLLVNRVTVSQAGDDGLFATAKDAASIAAHGPQALEIVADLPSRSTLQALADYIIATYSSPAPRVPTLAVQVTSLDDMALVDDVMDATVSTKVRVTGWPTQAAASSYDFFIEGWTEEFGPESHRIEWNVSPA